MPVEPPPSEWHIELPRRSDRDGLVGLGADLEPGTLLAAYRSGIFPMPIDGVLGWFSPDPRAVLPVDAVHVSRSLARSMRAFEIRVDTAFDEVVEGCADPARPGGWITPAMTEAYARLRDLGWAHSVEAWTAGGELAGGLFGISVGGFFAAESKFHRVTDGSKAAVAGLARLVAAGPAGPRGLVDVQWLSPHLATLGVVEVRRRVYLERLAVALALPSVFD